MFVFFPFSCDSALSWLSVLLLMKSHVPSNVSIFFSRFLLEYSVCLSPSLLKEFSESWSIHLRCLPHLQFTFNFSLLPEPFLCLCVPLILKYLSYSCCFTFFFSFFSNLYMQCFVSVYFSSTIAKNRRQIKIRFYLSLCFRGKKRVACCPRVKSWYCLKSVVCQSFNSTWK